jgi:membrane-associated phospholipid phosphatase
MVVSATTRPGPESPEHSSHQAYAAMELVLGCFLLSGASLAGFAFVHRPWPNRVDSIGLRLFPAHLSSRWATDLAHLGSMPVLVVGLVALCCIAMVSRDWARALSCVIAPMGAVLVVQLVAKPLVGRHFEGTSALSYPSGTVTAVAALAAGALLVSPCIAKPAVAVLGAVVVAAVCVAVVVLRWHYPTDALGGACVGVGAVFALDGALHWFSSLEHVRHRD